eukprot:2323494-Alexandrium_andersonii.AAC.1
MAGPYFSMAAGWKLLRQGLSIEPERRVNAAGIAYLGCKIEKTCSKLAGDGWPPSPRTTWRRLSILASRATA